MLQIVRCETCGGTGVGVTLSIERQLSQCKTCGNIEMSEWGFHFCSLVCFSQWQKKNDNKIPCRDCRETGWAFGFKENGTCATCGGKRWLTSIPESMDT